MTQPTPLHPSNAEELTRIAAELGAQVLRGWLQYPGPNTGDWEIAGQNLPDVLGELIDKQVILIVAAVDQKLVHRCGICGFELGEPGQLCPRCAVVREEEAAALADAKDVVDQVEEWLRGEDEDG